MNRIAVAGSAMIASILLAASGATTARAATPAPPVLVGDSPPRDPLPVDVAAALSVVQDFVAGHPDDLADAWVDDDGTLTIGVATASGHPLADQIADEVRSGTVRVGIADVARSHAALTAISDEVIGLDDAAVSGADGIFSSHIDARNNRVVVETGAAPASLLAGVAARYGPDAVAVRLIAGASGGTPAAARNADTSPFWGGANINAPAGGCTSGFPWEPTTSTYAMVTAGHCAPSGGSVSTPVSAMGSVTSGSRENWNSGIGTVYLTNQTSYRGDIALVAITPGVAGTNIYVGGVNSTSSKAITGMWSRRAQEGDKYCTGGASSGERCDWSVNWTQGNWKYATGETARNVVAASKGGYCVKAGDSGGPTYTATATSVTAKGIISGVGGYGGSDAYAGTFDPDCRNVFTDIWDAYYAFPGVLRHQ